MAATLSCLLATLALANADTSVCVTPGNDCETPIVHKIDGATKSVDLQAYAFNSTPIVDALIRARTRGAIVRVVLDRSYRKTAPAWFRLRATGIYVAIDDRHAIAHNKVVILDNHDVITGSFNFTSAAAHRNAENVIFTDDPAVVDTLEKNFDLHRQHSHLP